MPIPAHDRPGNTGTDFRGIFTDRPLPDTLRQAHVYTVRLTVPSTRQTRHAPPTTTARRLRLSITHAVPLTGPSTSTWLKKNYRAVLRQAGVGECAIHLHIVSDKEMAQLHQQHAGVAGTTDVLTFDLRDDPADPLIEADIVMCIDEAHRQANVRNHDVNTELLLYATHGLLHLLGYDDHDPAQSQRMHKREDELLQAVGLGEVYHATPHTRNMDTSAHPNADSTIRGRGRDRDRVRGRGL